MSNVDGNREDTRVAVFGMDEGDTLDLSQDVVEVDPAGTPGADDTQESGEQTQDPQAPAVPEPASVSGPEETFLTDQQTQALELGLPANASQKDIGKAFAAVQQRARQSAEEAYQRGLEQARVDLAREHQQAQRRAYSDPEPDPFVQPQEWKAWAIRQVRDEVLAETRQEVTGIKVHLAQQGYESSLKAWSKVAEQNGEKWDDLIKEANEFAALYPAVQDDVYRAKDPGEKIYELARMNIARKGSALTPEARAEQERAVEQRVIERLAKQRAEEARAPQNRIPRGVGSTSNGAGKSDLATPISEYRREAMTNPDKWEETKRSVFAGD